MAFRGHNDPGRPPIPQRAPRNQEWTARESFVAISAGSRWSFDQLRIDRAQAAAAAMGQPCLGRVTRTGYCIVVQYNPDDAGEVMSTSLDLSLAMSDIYGFNYSLLLRHTKHRSLIAPAGGSEHDNIGAVGVVTVVAVFHGETLVVCAVHHLHADGAGPIRA